MRFVCLGRPCDMHGGYTYRKRDENTKFIAQSYIYVRIILSQAVAWPTLPGSFGPIAKRVIKCKGNKCKNNLRVFLGGGYSPQTPPTTLCLRILSKYILSCCVFCASQQIGLFPSLRCIRALTQTSVYTFIRIVCLFVCRCTHVKQTQYLYGRQYAGEKSSVLIKYCFLQMPNERFIYFFLKTNQTLQYFASIVLPVTGTAYRQSQNCILVQKRNSIVKRFLFFFKDRIVGGRYY